MLASLVSKDGNTPQIAGWQDGREQPTAEQMAALKVRADKTDLAKMAKSQGVARYMSDDPLEVLKDGRFGTSFNLDGIWGGNMYAGGAGAILPKQNHLQVRLPLRPQNGWPSHRRACSVPSLTRTATKTST